MVYRDRAVYGKHLGLAASNLVPSVNLFQAWFPPLHPRDRIPILLSRIALRIRECMSQVAVDMRPDLSQ